MARLYLRSETVANFAPVNYPWRNRILFFSRIRCSQSVYFLLLPWFRWTTTFGDLWVACALLVTFILSVVIFSEDLRARGSRELRNLRTMDWHNARRARSGLPLNQRHC